MMLSLMQYVNTFRGALTFYKLAKGFKHINAFAATVQSARKTLNNNSNKEEQK